MATRVYQYGLLPPTRNAELVAEQMRASHRYRNQLITLERCRRECIRDALREYSDMDALEEAVRECKSTQEAAQAAIKSARKRSRKRSETEPQRQALAAAREATKLARARLGERRRQLREDGAAQARLDEINEFAGALRRALREQTEAYWGTYLLAEAEVDAAAKTTPLYDGVEPCDPRYARWTGDGTVGVQLQGGLETERVFGADPRLQIDRPDERAWWSESRSERRRCSRTKLRLRVGSEGRDPVWGEWTMLMHRPLPKGGRIKRALVHRRKRGPREVWAVDITVELPDGWTQGRCGNGGAVAVDIGWRSLGDDIRVGAWVGEDGAAGEVFLDASCISALRKAEDLRRQRDRNQDRMTEHLLSWLAEHRETLPEWLREATRHAHQWRSPSRWSRLAREWRERRFDGDVEGYESLEAWRYHEHHLWAWESGQGRKSHLRRREQYRVAADRLASQYSVLALEQFDLRQVARKAPTEAPAENQTARSNRQLSAPSELREALRNAFQRRGGTVIELPAQDTTRTCHECGHVDRWDAAAHIAHACSSCGVVWDQDENAARNLLDRYREQRNAAESAGTARNEKEAEKETKWQRVARLKAEKAARIGAARNAGFSAAE